MKKLFLSLVAAIVAATATYAQSSLVATLNHNNTFTAYHGATAFVEAMAAADNGDIITLSNGTFTATDITKAVTLRGAGSKEDKVTGKYMTQLSGDVELNIPTEVTEKLLVEGVVFGGITLKSSIDGAKFSNCKMTGKFSTNISYAATNWTFVDCNLGGGINAYKNSSISFLNCFVGQIYCNGTQVIFEFTNCLVVSSSSSGFSGNGPIKNATFTNCMLFHTNGTSSSSSLNDTNQAYNCIGYTVSGVSPFANINQSTNTNLTDEQYNALFKEGTFYELTDEAKALYIGNDGTEVGIYGGVLPFDSSIKIPQITNCSVAKQTTVDGKLSVDITVEAAQ